MPLRNNIDSPSTQRSECSATRMGWRVHQGQPQIIADAESTGGTDERIQ